MAFLYSMSSHKGFRGEQGNINTCMIHVLPPGPHFCTVTCILEIPSLTILSLCLDHLKVDKLSKGFFFVCFFVFYTENVNAVDL